MTTLPQVVVLARLKNVPAIPAFAMRDTKLCVPHVSKTKKESSCDKCMPVIALTKHVCPLTHVWSWESGLTPINVN
jgi:hypothetical protein